MSPKLLILFFDGVLLENLSLFHGQIDFVLFFLHWLEEPGVPLVSVILLSSTRSKMAMVRLPTTDPAQKLTFLLSISADGGGSPHFRFGIPGNHLASLSLPFRCPAT